VAPERSRATAARPRRDEEDDEVPRRRPTRSRDEDEDEEDERPRKKEKPKPKQEGSALPVVLIAGGLGAVLLVGAVVGVVMWLLRAPGNSSSNLRVVGQQPPIRPLDGQGGGMIGMPGMPGRPGMPGGPDPGLPVELAADTIEKVRQATVYLRVDLPNGDIAQGTGFFAMERGIVVTNAHVLGMLGPDSQPPNSVAVAINSGERDELKLTGAVVGVDRHNDLAVLRVAPPPGRQPTPLQIDPSGKLGFLQKVYIFGFPLGAALGKNITVSPSTISALRNDESGALHRIQVNGGMHPGNSGGPVTDSRGMVIGVSVSGIPGTPIAFAIPAYIVKATFDGRTDRTEFGNPYASGSTTKVPVRLTTLDPLNRAREVKVEVWAGNPGKPRPAGTEKPKPEPGDGERQTIAAAGGEGRYAVDVPLPRLGPGQVCWVQPLLVNAKGATQWGQAVSYTVDPASVLQRKSVVLEFKPPGSRIERTIKMSSNEAIHLYQGDEHITGSEKMEGYVLESLKPDSGGRGTGIELTMYRPVFTKERGNRKTPVPPEINAHISLYSPAFLVDFYNKARERRNYNDKAFETVPRDDRATVQSLFYTVCNTWEATTIPLPNRSVEPGKTWPATIPMLHLDEDTGRKSQVVLQVSCTYEGLRTVGGRKEAYIRLAGVAKGTGPRREMVLGKVSGHALFDVDRGFHRETKVTISTEIDTGRVGVRILVTDERTVTREEGNTQGIKPATPPAGTKPPPSKGPKIKGPLALVHSKGPVAGKEFTLTAYVENPEPGAMITLDLGRGLQRVGGTAKVAVPPVPAGAESPFSPVTWRVKALIAGKYTAKVVLNNGKAETLTIPVQAPPPD
jgi:S1-C subfamily serine protease